MQPEADTESETVEWGSAVTRTRWYDRFGGALSGRQARAGAAVVLVLGFALVLTAELLPWARVGQGEGVAGPPGGIPLSALNTLLVIGYHLSIAGVLALTAATVLGGPANRRFVAALALGWAAGHTVLLTSVYAWVERGAEFGQQLPQEGVVPVSAGLGLHSAVAGVVLLIAGVVLAGWWGDRSDDGPHPEQHDPDQSEDAGQVQDLTVTEGWR